MEIHKYTLNGLQEGETLHYMKLSWHFIIGVNFLGGVKMWL